MGQTRLERRLQHRDDTDAAACRRNSRRSRSRETRACVDARDRRRRASRRRKDFQRPRRGLHGALAEKPEGAENLDSAGPRTRKEVGIRGAERRRSARGATTRHERPGSRNNLRANAIAGWRTQEERLSIVLDARLPNP